MLTTSENVNEIAAALAKAQGAMDNANKDRSNPAFKSKYADLAAVREATSGPLSANGIAVLQGASTTADGVSVETRLIHVSGQWIACTIAAAPKDYTPQSIGSAITYLRRYGLMSMAGIAPEDDDGNAANGRNDAPAPSWPRREVAAPLPAPMKWSAAARAGFCAELGKLGLDYDHVAAWSESVGRPRPSLMEPTQRSALLAALLKPDTAAKLAAFIAAPVEVANDHR